MLRAIAIVVVACTVGVAAERPTPAGESGDDGVSRLPDDPRIAAFLLGRMPDDELLELMRSPRLGHPVIVFDEVLKRESLDDAARREAIAILAKINGSSVVREWAAAIERIAAEDEAAEDEWVERRKRDVPVVELLGRTLLSESREVLAADRRALAELAYSGPDARARRYGWAALFHAGGDPKAVLADAKSQTSRRIDGLGGIALAPDPASLNVLRDDVAELLSNARHVDVRRNGIRALVACDPSATTVRELLPRAKSGPDRRQTIDALATIPPESFPQDVAKPYLDAFVAFAESESAVARATEAYRSNVEHARGVAAVLPDAVAEPYRKRLAARDVPVVRVQAVRQEMRFDRKEIEVTAGRAVEIVFDNADDLPQNLVIVAPGAVEEVGRLADAMTGREAFDRGFVPESPKVLEATPLLDPHTSTSLVFEAPDEPGEYPFVSTIAEHWRNMQGVIRVISP